jgi:hypothetical protein
MRRERKRHRIRIKGREWKGDEERERRGGGRERKLKEELEERGRKI